MESEWDYVETVNDLKRQYDTCKAYYENKLVKLEYRIKQLTKELQDEKERSAFRFSRCQWTSSRPAAYTGYYTSFTPLQFEECCCCSSTYPKHSHCVICSSVPMSMTRD